MAEAAIGGAFLSAFCNVLLERMATREFLDFIKGRKINDNLFKKLKARMLSVNEVLDDAEDKHITYIGVRKWLDELKDALYDADDFVDEVAYEVLRSKIRAGSQRYGDQMRNFFSSRNPFRKGMDDRLSEILDSLESLVRQKDDLSLTKGSGEKFKPPSHMTATTSLVEASGVYGRDDDREAIVKLLLFEEVNGNNNLSVIPIVGMGGIGKTTLAQFVYNDSRVQKQFDVKAWTCVLEEFDVFKLTKDVLKEVASVEEVSTFETDTPNQLQLKLKDRLMGKKFLLVVDDVWKVSNDEWELLLKPFKFGANGSKIVVTTRMEDVASIMRTVPIYHLEGLNDYDGWSLFSRHAFNDENSSKYPSLEELGRKIVKKCKGLPLAAKALGSLLRTKRDFEEWEKILKSSLWNSSNENVLPALRLSYHYLPSHLKPCFAYCTIFPKDYEFEREELILLWMAEGFLVHSSQDKDMEEVGNKYFDDLVSRSFFQRSSGDISCFIMHDLMNDLAKFVSGEFCFRLEGDNTSMVTQKTRHLSYARMENDRFEGIYEAKLLRTFILVGWSSIDNEVMNDLFLKFRRLRVLSLSQYQSVAELPKSIGKLKHLRYLDLSTSSMKELPGIVTTLYNLQTLILHGCTNLILLPDSIGDLKYLRYFDLSGTSIERLPGSISSLCDLRTLILCQCKDLIELPGDMVELTNLWHLDIGGTKLQEMPPRMSELKNLRVLTNFIMSKQGRSNIKELGELHHLRRKLCISNLENIVDAEDAAIANLKGKRHLKELELRWNNDPDNSVRERCVLDQLQPHGNVECLLIFGYGGEGFPGWLGASAYSNMSSLKLSRCRNCLFLPPLGQLTSLKNLSISDFGRVVDVGPEFYGSFSPSEKPFGSLITLKFERMLKWQSWAPYAHAGAFPRLQELYITECPNLVEALPADLPSLTTLEIEGCLQLVASLPRAPCVLKMKLKDDSRDMLFKKLPSGLHSLKVDRFKSHDSVVDRMRSFHTTLEEIEIRNHDSLKCFPLELFPKLKSFRITRCPVLESIFPTEGEFSYLSSLEVRECPNLVSFFNERLPAPNLGKLFLLGCSHVESFPVNNMLPSTIFSLKIWDFQNLKYLDYAGLKHLKSLRELEICSCPKLQSLPQEGLPSSLSSLSISLCPQLEQRCQRGTGEEWEKICLIPHVNIGFHKINRP
ncbi:NB-ARC domain-containing disease resistance protein [Euphorbia peplus]|nr:NB-ARC domain-containing disease resistance protein [Euphorbia peplus]